MKRLTLIVLLGLLSACSPAARKPAAPVEVFTRHWHEPIYREDVPEQAEVGAEVQLFATPGEYEPASLGVRAEVALSKAHWSVSPLQGPNGAVIQPDRFEWRVTEYLDPTQFDPFRRWIRSKEHPLQPGFLQPATPVEIAAGSAQQFWLTVHVPDDAAAGTYRGTLSFEAGGSAPQSLPILLQVYGFRLQEVRASMFAAGDNWPLLESSFADDRAHGMNTVLINPGHLKVAGVYQDGRFTFPGMSEKVAEVVRLAQGQGLGLTHEIGVTMHHHLARSAIAALDAAGIKNAEVEGGFDDREDYSIFYEKGEGIELEQRFRGTYYPTATPYHPPTTEYGKLLYRGWIAAFRQLDSDARVNGWPKLWYWLTDEPHVNRGRLRSALTMCLAAQEAGSTSLITCNEPTVSEPDPEKLWFRAIGDEPDLRLAPFLKSRCYYNAYLSEETLERTRASGGVYGAYVNIYGNQPASVRFQTGMLAYRLTLDLIMMWSYPSVGTDPEKGPRGYLRDWEAVREGIDDLKYFEALQRAAQDERAPLDKRIEAKALLDELSREIPTNVRAVGFVDSFTGEWVRGKETWKAERFESTRRRVAQAIEGLAGR